MSAEAPAGAVYLDSSAIVMLVVREHATEALVAYLGAGQLRVTSALARFEVARALRRHGPAAAARATEVLDGLNLLALDDGLLERAAAIAVDDLRSLDAIHVASALQLEDELEALVGYDVRMLAAARRLGVPVTTP